MISANNWTLSKIGDFLEVTNGKTNTDDAIIGGNYPLFDRSTEIKRSNKFLFDTEAIIIPGEGKEFYPRYYQGKFDLHQRAYAIFPKQDKKLNLKYLYYWIHHNQNYLLKMAVGSTVKSLRLYMLRNFPLSFPNIEVQQKIVNILTSVDDEIQKTDQIIQKTEVLKQGLMQLMLTKGQTVSIKEIATVKRGASPRPIGDPSYFAETGRGWIRIADVTSSYKYLNETSQYLSKSGEEASVKVDQGDLIMSICATVGKPIFVNIPACIHDGCVVFRNLKKSIIDPDFFFYSLLYNEGQLRSKGQTGSQMNLNTTIVEKTKIQIPELTKQKKIVRILKSIDQKLDFYSQERKRLQKLKKGIMQDIFSQKLQIN